MRTQADRDEDLALGRELERKDAEIDRLRRDCAELYQVIGCLAGTLRDDPQTIKALDNAHAAASGEPRPHDDLLPFTAVNPDADDIADGVGEQRPQEPER